MLIGCIKEKYLLEVLYCYLDPLHTSKRIYIYETRSNKCCRLDELTLAQYLLLYLDLDKTKHE